MLWALGSVFILKFHFIPIHHNLIYAALIPTENVQRSLVVDVKLLQT